MYSTEATVEAKSEEPKAAARTDDLLLEQLRLVHDNSLLSQLIALFNSSLAWRSSRVSGVAHASRVLVSASRRNNLFEKSKNLHGVPTRFRKVRDRETRSPARETHALPFLECA